MGKSGTFQHETLSNEGCDYYMFIDIKPNLYYITILKKYNLRNRCEITGKKATLRKNTNNVFKYDLTESMIKRSINKGFSIIVDDNTSYETLNKFITTII